MSDEFLNQDGVKALLEEHPASDAATDGAKATSGADTADGGDFTSQDEVDAMLKPFPLAVAHHGKTEREIAEEAERENQDRFAKMALDPEFAQLVREFAEVRGKAGALASKYDLSASQVFDSIRQ